MTPRILRTIPRGWLFPLVLGVAWIGLGSCQKATIIEEDPSTAPGKHYVHFRIMDSAGIPDSIWYHSPLDSGTESFSVSVDPASGFRIVTFPFLNQIDDRDSMTITSFRLGVRIGTSVARHIDFMEIGTNRLLMTGSDSLAVKLFRVFDSLRKTNPVGFPSKTAPQDSLRRGFQKSVAEMVFKGHPASLAYRRTTPFGLDTAMVRVQALGLVARSGLTLGEVVRAWNLGMDYTTARKSLASMNLDSLSVNPFRQRSPLHLDTLHLGEAACGLTGKIQGTRGIQGITFAILNDSGDRTDRFILADAPDLRSNPFQVDFEGHPTFAPRNGTSLGAYSLSIQIQDSLGNQESYRVPFRVAGFLDHVGPTIRWISPSQNKVFENKDSLVTIQVEVNDPSGVDSVWIDGRSAVQDAQTWTVGNWHIPVSDLGIRLRVRAQDHFGNRTDSFIVVSRRPAPVFASPTLSLVSPTAGTLAGTEEDSTEIIWKAVLPDGTVDSVWIDGRPAHSDSGQLWRLRVSLPPTGVPVVIPVRAHSSMGTESRNFAPFGRHRDTLGPVLQWARPHPGDTLPYSTALADIELRAQDHFGVDAVWIDGSPAKLSNGVWKGSALLGAPGSRNQVAVRGQDHFGNSTDSILSVHRRDLPNDLVPTFRPLKPSQRTGVHVPYDSTSIWVRWVISDLSGIDSASVQIDQHPAVKENDSTWGARVALPPADRKFINVIATNKKGNGQADVMEVFRDPESSAPRFERLGGLRDTVLFGDSSFTPRWKVIDNALATVTIGGNKAQSAGDIFSRAIGLKRGVQWIYLKAEDSSRNICRDSIRILYLPGMQKIDSTEYTIEPESPNFTVIEDIPYQTEAASLRESTAKHVWKIATFFSDTTFITTNEFLTLMHPNQAIGTNNTDHITSISWYEAILFCNKKSKVYNLPEAYVTSSLDSSEWYLADNPSGFKLPSMSEAYGFRARQNTQNIYKPFNEWITDWQHTSLDTQIGPTTGNQRAILPNSQYPDVLLGLPPGSQPSNIVFRTVLPLKAAHPSP